MKQKLKKCKQALAYICDNLAQHEDSIRCQELKKHIIKCSDCSAYLDSMEKTISFYKRYPNPKIQATRKSRIMSELVSTIKKVKSNNR